jgi:serine/threonine-protein kinase
MSASVCNAGDRGSAILPSVSERSTRGDDPTLDAFGSQPSSGTSEAEAPARLAGRYELLGLLGVGGMGSVYRARDLELGELVALKMLRRELVGTVEALERFRQEVRLARRVTHACVARTFDIGEHAGERFLTMELVDGGSLTRTLSERGALALDEVVRIGASIADGLAAAHAVGVVHRDLKPDNVLLGKDGRVVITDFGIARATDAAGRTGVGQTVGTPAYMAPEQVEAKAIDARADLYALGLVLYEMITGVRAWPGEAAFAVAAARLVQPPPDPATQRTLPPALSTLVRACLARDPTARPESAARVAADLRAIASVATASHTPPSAPAIDRSIDRTLAVAPIRDAGVAEDRWIADGLGEDLTDALSMVAGLRVRGHRSIPRDASDPRELGRLVDVDVVVDGSVRRNGDALRISLRLLSVRDGFQIWARRFDGRIGDLMTINDEAARAITAALEGATTHARVAPSDADAEAIELYLRARPRLSTMLDSRHAEAEAMLDRALELAPNHPVILSERSLSRIGRTFVVGDHQRVIAQARDEAERALAIAPMLGEPWVALAHVHNNSDRPADAVTSLRRAIRNAPSLGRAHDLLGRILLEAALYDAALHHLERAIWLDPVVLAFPYVDVVRLHALRGDRAALDAAQSRLRARSGTHHRLMAGRLGVWLGEVIETDPAPPGESERNAQINELSRRAVTEGRLSAEDFAEFDRLRSNATLARARRLFSQISAEFAARIGDPVRVRSSVETAVGYGLVDIAWMDSCPPLAPYRSETWWSPLRAIVHSRAQPVIDAFLAPDPTP